MAYYKVISALITLLVIGACSTISAIEPVEPPLRSSFDPALVAKGAQLAAIGNCAVCHTAQDGKPYGGGRPLKTR